MQNTPSIIVREFKSLSEFVDYSENDYENDGPTSSRSSIQYASQRFTATDTKAQAFQLLRTGYLEGSKRMESLLETLQAQVILPTLQQTVEQGIEGVCPNVEAFVQGIPEDMFFFSSAEANAPPTHLSIQLELAIAANIPPQLINIVGAVLMAATYALRQQGCSVTYFVTFTVQNHQGNRWQAIIPVPSNLDIDTLSFIFTHPAMLRTLCFSAMEHEDSNIRNAYQFQSSGGYSRATIHRIPDVDQILALQSLTARISGYTQEDQMKSAAALLTLLVNSKFNLN